MTFEVIIGIIVGAATLICSLVAFIITFIRTGNVKKSLSAATEVLDEMKQRLPNYREKEPAKGQIFSRLVPNYFWNEKTKELEHVGERDIQKEIDSHRDCELSRILAKLMPEEYGEVLGLTGYAGDWHKTEGDVLEPVVGVSKFTSPLDDLADLEFWADEMAAKYQLGASASLKDIVSYITTKAKTNEQTITNTEGGAKDVPQKAPEQTPEQ